MPDPGQESASNGGWPRKGRREPRPPVQQFLSRRFLWTLGAVLCVTLALMMLSGLILATDYTATAKDAFASIETIERRVPWGWLLRSLHMTGASLFLGALYLHLFRGLHRGSYREPRELVWITGVLLLLMTMVAAFAGYVLPWGQMSYWGADIAGKALEPIPLIGPFLEHVFFGGNQPGDGTLHRLFVLHFVMAFAIVAVVGVHVAAVHKAGGDNLSGGAPDTLSFAPYFPVRDAWALALFALVLTVLVFFFPDLLNETANYRPANPLHTPESIEPEWYFLPFFGILQAVPSKLGGLVASVGAVLVLFFVPWLDTSPRRSTRLRPIYRLSMLLLVAAFCLLGIAGRQHVAGNWLIAARCATLYYFFHFLVLLPVLSHREKDRPA